MSKQSEVSQQNIAQAAPRRPNLLDAAQLDEIRKTLVAVTQPWWRGERVSENGLIYGVNMGGSRPPLVWCFQGYEEFAALAGALGPDQPLYGMRSGHMVVPTTAENLMHMAVLFAEEIHSLGLPGPLFLGGNCQAALVAQKTAEILMASGRVVALLMTLNAFLFTPYAGRIAMMFGRYDRTSPFVRFHDADRLLRLNFPHATVDTLPSEHAKLFQGRILDLWSDLVRQRMDEALTAYPGSFPIWSLRAEITAPPEITAKPGSLFDLPVILRNTSDVTWAPTSQSGIAVGNHWRQADGTMLQWLDGRQTLDHPLAPGDEVEVLLLVRVPGQDGDYLLEVDLEQAGVMWLSEVGGKIVTCRVAVSASA